MEAPDLVDTFLLRAEDTLDGVRDGVYPVEVVDCEGVRRCAEGCGYCDEEDGEEESG